MENKKIDGGKIEIINNISLAEKKEEKNEIEVAEKNEIPASTSKSTNNTDENTNNSMPEIQSSPVVPTFDNVQPQVTFANEMPNFNAAPNISATEMNPFSMNNPLPMNNFSVPQNSANNGIENSTIYKDAASVDRSYLAYLEECKKLYIDKIADPTKTVVEVANRAMKLVEAILNLGGINLDLFNEYEDLKKLYDGIKQDKYGSDVEEKNTSKTYNDDSSSIINNMNIPGL